VSGAIELDPKHAIAYASWAAALANLGSHKEAIEKYDKATKFGAQDAFVYTNWGISLANWGSHKESIEKYKRATELDSNTPSPTPAGASLWQI
jgi:Tfp pilus assembly protein PilF